MALNLPKKLVVDIRQQLEGMYPDEGCGVMLGHYDHGIKAVKEIFLISNTREEGAARTRYLMDPKEFLRAEKVAREKGLDIVGIYHSHPDHPARPSQYDLDHAWPLYSYVIVAVEKGASADFNSFELKEVAENNKVFEPERIQEI